MAAPRPGREGPVIDTLEDVLVRLSQHHGSESDLQVHVRGTVLSVAQDWVRRLPAGAERKAALELLAAAGTMAAAAAATK